MLLKLSTLCLAFSSALAQSYQLHHRLLSTADPTLSTAFVKRGAIDASSSELHLSYSSLSGADGELAVWLKALSNDPEVWEGSYYQVALQMADEEPEESWAVQSVRLVRFIPLIYNVDRSHLQALRSFE